MMWPLCLDRVLHRPVLEQLPLVALVVRQLSAKPLPLEILILQLPILGSAATAGAAPGSTPFGGASNAPTFGSMAQQQPAGGTSIGVIAQQGKLL